MEENTSTEQNKIFVGNLPYSVRSEELRALASEVEGVEITDAVVILDRDRDNRSKGYGFVTFANAEMAQKAVEALNNKEIESRNLSVNLARPQERRNNNGGGYNRSNRY